MHFFVGRTFPSSFILFFGLFYETKRSLATVYSSKYRNFVGLSPEQFTSPKRTTLVALKEGEKSSEKCFMIFILHLVQRNRDIIFLQCFGESK